MQITFAAPQRQMVRDLRPGAVLDLEGDPFADNDPSLHSLLVNLYQTVYEVEVETPTCIAVSFDDFDTVGFPPDHTVTVVGYEPPPEFP